MEGLLRALRWIGGSREGTVVAAACEKTGGMAGFQLGISHVPQNHISRGGRSGGWLMYFVSFLYIQPRKLGDNIQFHEHVCQLGLEPSSFRRFWQAHHGYVLKWCLKNTSKSWGYPTPWELYSDAVSEIKRVPVDGMFYGSGIPGVGFQWVSSITRYLESL